MAQVPPAAPAASAAASRPPSTEYSQRFSTQDRHRAEATKRYLEDKYTKMRIQEKERRDRYVFISDTRTISPPHNQQITICLVIHKFQ